MHRFADEAARVRSRDHLRLVVEHSAQALVAAQDRGQQMAVRASHVDERIELPEVVSARDRGVLGARDAGHRFGEHAVLVGVGSQPGEVRHPVHVVEAHLAGADPVRQLLPAAPVVPVHHHQREAAQRSRYAGAKRGGARRQPEATVGRLGEHADAGQRAQDAVECIRLRSDALGEHGGRERPLRELVRDA